MANASREPQLTPPKTCAIDSGREMIEKLKREIERLAGSVIREEIVDHGLNAVMTAWHLTDWTWREIQGSIPRVRSVTARAGTPIRELKQFQEFVKRDCPELAYCEGIVVSAKHFAFSKVPVFFHQGNRAIQNKSAPDWQGRRRQVARVFADRREY